MNALSPERSTPTESLSGLIERVTFFNEESGFAVLRVKVPGHRDEVTIIGSLPSVSAGEWLAAEGWWVRDKEHGLQFKAITLKTVPPTTVEGIERYLSSGLVKGIGPVLAKKLVAKFGTDVLSVIEYRSPELQGVDGIGPKRRERIKRAWQDAKQVREIMLFLHGHGVSVGVVSGSHRMDCIDIDGNVPTGPIDGNPAGDACECKYPEGRCDHSIP